MKENNNNNNAVWVMLFSACALMGFAVLHLTKKADEAKRNGTWEYKTDTLYVQDAHTQVTVLDWSGATTTGPELLLRTQDSKTFVFPSTHFRNHYNVWIGYADNTEDIKFARTGDTLVMNRGWQTYKGRRVTDNMTIRNISLQNRIKQH